MWKDILKMMTPTEFMEEVKKHVGGGEIENKSQRKHYGQYTVHIYHLILTDINGEKYKLVSSSKAGGLDNDGEFKFICHGKQFESFSLKKILEEFKKYKEYESGNIENIGPLGAFLGGSAAVAGKTLVEDEQDELQ